MSMDHARRCTLATLVAALAIATHSHAGAPLPDRLLLDGFEHPRDAAIRPLSDEFDDAATLGDWRRIWRDEHWNADQLEAFDIAGTRAGWMTMLPHTSSWFEDYRGELAYKAISGDFIASVRVESRNRAGTGAPGSTTGGAVSSEYSLAGILVRAPRVDVVCCDASWWRVGHERYVFLSFGSADQTGTYQFEVKTTRAAIPPEPHSVSVLDISAASGSSAELRAARVGSSLIMLLREPAQPWRVHRRYARADFPEQLQVGMTVYTDWAIASTWPYAEQNANVILHAWQEPQTPAAPDLRAQFDYFRFERPHVPAALIGVNLADPTVVSDAELLAFLGDAVP
jgi:hypothetical protein